MELLNVWQKAEVKTGCDGENGINEGGMSLRLCMADKKADSHADCPPV